MNEDHTQFLNEQQARGTALSERWEKMPGKQIRGYSNNKQVNFLEGVDKDDRQTRALLSILMENTLNYIRNMDETTRMLQVGSFEKFVFPIIRAVYANLVAADLVTVQPLAQPTGLVFYFDVLYGTQKGNIARGSNMFDARTGPDAGFHYTDEVVEQERIGTGTGAAALVQGNLAFLPIRSGTVRFTDGTQIVTDDGNGNLVGAVNAGGVNTINYATGAYSVTFAANIANAAPVTADYEYNNEGGALGGTYNPANIPEVDLVLTSAPVTARSQKLRARWSLEGQQDLKAYHGIDAEVELVAFMANEIAKELNYKIVRHLAQIAAAGAVTWDRTPPAGVQWIWHKESFYDTLIAASNMVFSATQRYQTTWCVAGVGVCNIIETLSKFKPDSGATSGTPAPADVAGIRKIGKLGEHTIYKDPTYAHNDFLMGFKGKSFLSTGYIWAPYLGLYTTPTVVLDDFVSRKGMAQRSALKVVNSNMYVTGRITQTGGEFGPAV